MEGNEEEHWADQPSTSDESLDLAAGLEVVCPCNMAKSG